MTVYLHESHRVIGAKEDEFEALYREWMEVLAGGDEARLLYYCNQVHGASPAYRAVTITAVADGAWEGLARRVDSGDLRAWVARADECRYHASAKLLFPVAWSPMSSIDLGAVPTDGASHEPSLFMEDTGWPITSLQDYVDFWERDYFPMLDRQPAGDRLLEIQACWTPAFGTVPRKEGVLWQRVHNLDRLLQLFVTELPPERKAAGTYMATALTFRDQWRSRLLRTATWSPQW